MKEPKELAEQIADVLQEKKAEVSAAVRHPEVRMKAEPAL